MDPELLEQALAQAAQRHFSILFDVLMVDPSPAGLIRFEAGLQKLADTHGKVADILRDNQGDAP